jgi:hypothetical protein
MEDSISIPLPKISLVPGKKYRGIITTSGNVRLAYHCKMEVCKRDIVDIIVGIFSVSTNFCSSTCQVNENTVEWKSTSFTGTSLIESDNSISFEMEFKSTDYANLPTGSVNIKRVGNILMGFFKNPCIGSFYLSI